MSAAPRTKQPPSPAKAISASALRADTPSVNANCSTSTVPKAAALHWRSTFQSQNAPSPSASDRTMAREGTRPEDRSVTQRAGKAVYPQTRAATAFPTPGEDRPGYDWVTAHPDLRGPAKC